MHKINKSLNQSILLILIVLCFIYCNDDEDLKISKPEMQIQSLSEHVGEKFSIANFIDTSGNPIEIKYENSDFTIIDFWINECPPCNIEMSQFKELIKGKEKQVQIISISVSSYSFWKKIFTDNSNRYRFLKDSLPNWKHVNLRSMDDPKFKNSISLDRYEELKSKLNVAFFPSYFVLDNTGTIKSRPISAVEYIKQNLSSN